MATLADAPRRVGVQARTAIVAVLAASGTAVVIGIPTDVIPNPWFGRQVAVRPADVLVLIAQPFLGALAVALAVTALVVRVRAIRRGACPVPRRTAAERT
jgi:hypothetical protein